MTIAYLHTTAGARGAATGVVTLPDPATARNFANDVAMAGHVTSPLQLGVAGLKATAYCLPYVLSEGNRSRTQARTFMAALADLPEFTQLHVVDSNVRQMRAWLEQYARLRGHLPDQVLPSQVSLTALASVQLPTGTAMATEMSPAASLAHDVTERLDATAPGTWHPDIPVRAALKPNGGRTEQEEQFVRQLGRTFKPS